MINMHTLSYNCYSFVLKNLKHLLQYSSSIDIRYTVSKLSCIYKRIDKSELEKRHTWPNLRLNINVILVVKKT